MHEKFGIKKAVVFLQAQLEHLRLVRRMPFFQSGVCSVTQSQ